MHDYPSFLDSRMKPKSVFLIRADSLAFVCPHCPDKHLGEIWANDRRLEIAYQICSPCAAGISLPDRELIPTTSEIMSANIEINQPKQLKLSL